MIFRIISLIKRLRSLSPLQARGHFLSLQLVTPQGLRSFPTDFVIRSAVSKLFSSPPRTRSPNAHASPGFGIRLRPNQALLTSFLLILCNRYFMQMSQAFSVPVVSPLRPPHVPPSPEAFFGNFVFFFLPDEVYHNWDHLMLSRTCARSSPFPPPSNFPPPAQALVSSPVSLLRPPSAFRIPCALFFGRFIQDSTPLFDCTLAGRAVGPVPKSLQPPFPPLLSPPPFVDVFATTGRFFSGHLFSFKFPPHQHVMVRFRSVPPEEAASFNGRPFYLSVPKKAQLLPRHWGTTQYPLSLLLRAPQFPFILPPDQRCLERPLLITSLFPPRPSPKYSFPHLSLFPPCLMA